MSAPISERVFAVVLFLSSMGVVDAFTRNSLPGDDPNVFSTAVPLSTALIEGAILTWGAFLVLTRGGLVIAAGRAAWPIVGLVAFTVLSAAWSIQPLLTLRKSVLVLASTLLGLYLGERFSVEELARLLAIAICVMIVATLVLFCVAPGRVVDYTAYNGAWKGLSIGKNSFGGYMAVAVALLLLARFRRFRALRFAFLAGAGVLVLLSRSATSVVVCALVVAAMPLWRLVRLSGSQRWLAYTIMPLVLLVTGYVVTGNSELLFHILGRDSSLTGRTQLWSSVLPAIGSHPILGYGYGAFWTGFSGEALDVLLRAKWLAKQADNGYIDLCLGMGVAGVAVFVFAFASAARMAIRYLRSDGRPIGLWPITYLTFFLLHNVCESHLLETRSLEFLLFAAITASLAWNARTLRTGPRPVPDLQAMLLDTYSSNAPVAHQPPYPG